jgi:hypothetical protein
MISVLERTPGPEDCWPANMQWAGMCWGYVLLGSNTGYWRLLPWETISSTSSAWKPYWDHPFASVESEMSRTPVLTQIKQERPTEKELSSVMHDFVLGCESKEDFGFDYVGYAHAVLARWGNRRLDQK